MHTTPKNGQQGKAVFAEERGVPMDQLRKREMSRVLARTQRKLRWHYALQLHATSGSCAPRGISDGVAWE